MKVGPLLSRTAHRNEKKEKRKKGKSVRLKRFRPISTYTFNGYFNKNRLNLVVNCHLVFAQKKKKKKKVFFSPVYYPMEGMTKHLISRNTIPYNMTSYIRCHVVTISTSHDTTQFHSISHSCKRYNKIPFENHMISYEVTKKKSR